MSLVFYNPGTLDLRTIRTFGVNVKPNTDNPIGYFGTGMKYAISVALRLGCKVRLVTGGKTHIFYTQTTNIRGKDFPLVYMDDDQLPFTLELGKDWEAWQAYREFLCNARDEGGDVEHVLGDPQIDPDQTAFIIDGSSMMHAHRNREDFMLELGVPLLKTPHFEVYEGMSSVVFYQGFKAQDLDPPSLYTYNILASSPLTEDRTLKSINSLIAPVVVTTLEMMDDKFTRDMLTSSDDTFEGQISWNFIVSNPSEPFLKFAEGVDAAIGVNSQWVKLLIRHGRRKDTRFRSPTQVEERMILRALEALKLIDVYPTMPIRIHAGERTNVLGYVDNGRCILSPEVFRQGTKILAGTIYEEWVHISTGFPDYSLQFQNHLINTLMTVIEQIKGDPI